MPVYSHQFEHGACAGRIHSALIIFPLVFFFPHANMMAVLTYSQPLVLNHKVHFTFNQTFLVVLTYVFLIQGIYDVSIDIICRCFIVYFLRTSRELRYVSAANRMYFVCERVSFVLVYMSGVCARARVCVIFSRERRPCINATRMRMCYTYTSLSISLTEFVFVTGMMMLFIYLSHAVLSLA